MTRFCRFSGVALALVLCASTATADLRLNRLSGFQAKVLRQVTVTQTDTDSSNAAQAAYTFSAVSLGAAAWDRVIVVGAGARRSGTPSLTISSITIGGVTATSIVSVVLNGGDSNVSCLFAALVPTGTTGDVVVTYSGTMDRSSVGVFRMVGTGGKVAAVSTGSDTGVDASTTVNVSGLGAVIAHLGYSNTAAGSITWTGVTEDYDEAGAWAAGQYSGGNDEVPAGEAGRTVTSTGSGAVSVMVAASWAPR